MPDTPRDLFVRALESVPPPPTLPPVLGAAAPVELPARLRECTARVRALAIDVQALGAERDVLAAALRGLVALLPRCACGAPSTHGRAADVATSCAAHAPDAHGATAAAPAIRRALAALEDSL